MPNTISRRELLAGMGATGLLLSKTASAFTAAAPVAPVAIARCKTYTPAELTPVLDGMFDKLGGLGRLVQGKTVAIKLNFNGGPTVRLGHLPLGDTHWPHPNLLAATIQLMARAGAYRVRLVEGAAAPRTDPFEEHMLDANWDPRQFLSAAPRVEFEEHQLHQRRQKVYTAAGAARRAAVSSLRPEPLLRGLQRLRQHRQVQGSPHHGRQHGDEKPLRPDPPDGLRQRGREVGRQRPGLRQRPDSDPAPRIAPAHHGRAAEIDAASPREDNYRVPRVIADLTAARPVHLAIVDGITTMAGGQTPDPWCTPVAPGFLIAGTNVVNTAAVAMAAMNYDPRAPKGTSPFDRCDNKLLLAEQLGVGSADLNRIEVAGASIQEAMFDFRALREKRRASGAERPYRRRPPVQN